MAAGEATGEAKYYQAVKDWLTEILPAYFMDFHLEITAHGKFSSTLKTRIPSYREIIFSFLKEAAPDITGFVIRDQVLEFIVVELKTKAAKLDDIYQTRKYAELFDARYALLISTEEIPEEIRRLSRVAPQLLTLPGYKRLTLVKLQLDGEHRSSEWFPDDPFAK